MRYLSIRRSSSRVGSPLIVSGRVGNTARISATLIAVKSGIVADFLAYCRIDCCVVVEAIKL